MSLKKLVEFIFEGEMENNNGVEHHLAESKSSVKSKLSMHQFEVLTRQL